MDQLNVVYFSCYFPLEQHRMLQLLIQKSEWPGGHDQDKHLKNLEY